MAKLPRISTREAVRAFRKAGFRTLPKRGKGSHVRIVRDSDQTVLTIPDRHELATGTLRALIRDANLTVDEFVDGM